MNLRSSAFVIVLVSAPSALAQSHGQAELVEIVRTADPGPAAVQAATETRAEAVMPPAAHPQPVAAAAAAPATGASPPAQVAAAAKPEAQSAPAAASQAAAQASAEQGDTQAAAATPDEAAAYAKGLEDARAELIAMIRALAVDTLAARRRAELIVRALAERPDVADARREAELVIEILRKQQVGAAAQIEQLGRARRPPQPQAADATED